MESTSAASAPATPPAVAAAEPPRTDFAGSTPAAAPDKPAAPVFPAAPALAAPAGVEVASIQPAAYSGPVPSYLDSTRPLAASGRGDIEKLIDKYALLYQVPADLVRRVVNRESTFNPRAYNRGHWGLMQIKHATARGMGYDGPASGLFDAETNLKYAVKYLRGAWLVAEGDARRADRLYQTGYYYEAKRKGMLEETGLGIDRRSRHRMKADDVRLDPEGIVRPPVLPVGAPG
jgi:soluble lytic murein transglycosylase-like protein